MIDRTDDVQGDACQCCYVADNTGDTSSCRYYYNHTHDDGYLPLGGHWDDTRDDNGEAGEELRTGWTCDLCGQRMLPLSRAYAYTAPGDDVHPDDRD